MKNIFLKIVLAVIGFVIVSAIGISIFLNTVKIGNSSGELTLEDLKELSEKVGDDRINILLLGVDSLDASQEHENMRTDTMMILSVNPKTKTAFILSIPRDTRVEIEGYRYKFNKINTAHSIGGMEATLKAVKKLLSIDIHHFIKIDYQALSKTVNDIGGVEVDVPMDMYYEDPYANPPLVIDIKQGLQVLDGDKAMQFLRFRYGYANQDLGRIESQQQFMTSFISKILSVESLANIPKFIETFYRYVQTDMSLADMLQTASKCIDIKSYNIRKETLTGEAKMLYGTSYYIVEEETVRTQIDELLRGDYFISDQPLEALSNQESSQEEPNETLAYIVILNGNGRQGLAQRAKDLLKINNIEVEDSANADNFDYKETIIHYKDNEPLAQEIAKILGVSMIKQENMAYYGRPTDILIILGEDFKK